jgi:hypothetical protein
VVDPISTGKKGGCPCLETSIVTGGCERYDPSCVLYAPPACNNVLFANTTLATPSLVSLPVGNIFYQETGLILYCMPTSISAPPNNLTFEGMVSPYFGDISVQMLVAWSSGLIFGVGQISISNDSGVAPLSCPCNSTQNPALADTSSQDLSSWPCSYAMAPLVFDNATIAALGDYDQPFNSTPPLYTFAFVYEVVINITNCTFATTATSTSSSSTSSFTLTGTTTGKRFFLRV